jgi:hypothetical protein
MRVVFCQSVMGPWLCSQPLQSAKVAAREEGDERGGRGYSTE